MPLTPFHWGPSLLLGLVLFPLFDLPALLIASVIVDLEPLFLLLSPYNQSGVLHAFFHSHLGASLAGIALIPALYLCRNLLSNIFTLLGLPQRYSLFKVSLTSLLGPNLHVFLDAFIYYEMHPFFPLLGNPLYGLFSAPSIYLFCVVSVVVAIPLYLFQVLRANNEKTGS